MKTIEFDVSFADYLVNPEISAVKDLFDNNGLEEWAGGSTMSVMNYEDSDYSASLTIMAQPDYGFSILFGDSQKNEAILTEGGRSDQPIQIGIGDSYVFRYQLVSKETAWKAVEHFMQTGKRLESLNWQKYEVPDVEFAEVEKQAA